MGKSRVGSLDTNILLRLILGDVPAQVEAVEKLLAQESLFEVPDAALIEMVYVLENLLHKERALIQENVLSIVRYKQFRTDKRLFTLCMPLFVAHPSLSITDCVLLAHAQLRKATPLYTFDQKLAKNSDGNARIPV